MHYGGGPGEVKGTQGTKYQGECGKGFRSAFYRFEFKERQRTVGMYSYDIPNYRIFEVSLLTSVVSSDTDVRPDTDEDSSISNVCGRVPPQ